MYDIAYIKIATGQSSEVPNSDNNIQEQPITTYCEINYHPERSLP